MEEVKKALGNLKEEPEKIKPGLGKFDRLFYQAIISREPTYGFLRFLVSIGLGEYNLTPGEINELTIEFVKDRRRFIRYEPRGIPIKDTRFRLLLHLTNLLLT